MINGSLMKQFFNDGNPIHIEFRDELRNKRVYRTIIAKSAEDRIVLILPEENPIPVHPGVKLSVICYNPQQSDSFYLTSEVIDYQHGTPPLLTITMPALFEAVSRRKFFRCDVDLPFSYFDRDNVEQKGKVVNLSASGLMAVITSDIRLKSSQQLECLLTLPIIPEQLKFTAKIIRIEHTDKDFQRALAMSFENVTEKFQNDIIKYLFQRQRELIKLGHIKVGRI